jgi:AcrR family transcriptional regulator
MSTRANQTRTRLLAAARALFEARGYHDVGLEEIGAAAGVSRQAVYLHFGSKPQLLAELFNWVEEQERLSDLLAPVFAASSGLEALLRLVDAHATFERRIAAIAAVAESARKTAPEMEALVTERMAIRHRAVREIMVRIRDEGRLRTGWTADDAAAFVWALLSPPAYRLLVHDRGWSGRRWSNCTKQLLLDAFIADERDDRDAGSGANLGSTS